MIPPIDSYTALEILNSNDPIFLAEYLAQATRVRCIHFGNDVEACAIINAKCGSCTENCNFCPQSIFSTSKVDEYPLCSAQEILEAAQNAEKMGATRFGIVTSGRTIQTEEEMQILCDAVKLIREKTKISPCGSLGILTYEQLLRLKKAGMERYHHNLETSKSYYPSVCTTRTYEDQTRTVRDAQRAGMSVCSGGLFGLGETNEQRIEMFQTLQELNVDSIPINFLTPIPGTAQENRNDLTPYMCIKIIIVARLMLPKQRIRICGGREKNLRELQSLIFSAGADSMMIGNYLVTTGRTLEKDLDLLKDLNLTLVKN